VIAGQIGSPKRLEFTVIGDTVNLAARLEAMTRQVEAPLVFDTATASLLADDPELTPRLPGTARVPLARVVADSRLRTPLDSRLVRTARDVPTWIATRTNQRPAVLAPYLEAGVQILSVPRAKPGLDLGALLGALAQRGVTRVMAEGGAGLAAALLRGGFVDRISWFHAPAIMGGDGLPAVQPLPLAMLSAMPRFRRVASRPVGADWLTEFQREENPEPCSPGS
jgi:diaminohydroxyphosphoribosylaminopyrimidine deaminase/5-amino-6-(5-phosphoribosylamino)uracil reductase